MQKSKLQFKKYLLLTSAIVVSFLVVAPAFAAETFFGAKTQEIKVNQIFEVGVFINTDDESINAIEGKIIFPQDLLEIKRVNDGNSIINFWIEKPKTESGQVAFSGIVPGGYDGNQGLIFSIIFSSKKAGNGAIEFSEVKALRNDGKGTEAPLTISNFRFAISEISKPAEQTQIVKEDRDPPEELTPQITADQTIFDGKWFLVFATQDKGSGIDHYEIQENRKERIENRKWIIGESPYLLKDQGLKSYIYVKAVDKSGNERIVVLPPQKPLSWYQNYWILGILIIIGLIIAGIILRKTLWRKHAK